MPTKKRKKVETAPTRQPNRALLWLRAYANMTQTEAAAILGERRVTYARWERGDHAAKKGTLTKFCRAIGFDPQYIPSRLLLTAKAEVEAEVAPVVAAPPPDIENRYRRYQLAWISTLAGVKREEAAELLGVEGEAYARWFKSLVTVPHGAPEKLAKVLDIPIKAIPTYGIANAELGISPHPFPSALQGVIYQLKTYAEHYSPDYDKMTVRELIERLESQLQPLPGYPAF